MLLSRKHISPKLIVRASLDVIHSVWDGVYGVAADLFDWSTPTQDT